MRTCWLILFMFVCTGVVAADDPFCAALSAALDSSAADAPFADVSENDTGLGHESTLELPGAKLCLIQRQGAPASWSCVIGHETKYVLAQQKWKTLASRVEACLGIGWARTEILQGKSLRAVELTHPDRRPVVRIMATRNVQRVHRWKGHRLVLSVFSSRPDDDQESE